MSNLASSLRPVVLVIFFFSSFGASAQWSSSPLENNAITTKSDRENSCTITTDGNGGAIIAWWNYDSADNDYDIYAQRIDENGVIKWASGGVPVCATAFDVHVPHIVSDGNGGAIIAWIDKRTSKNELFLQKIDASGVVQWTPNGVSVGTAPNHHQHGSPVLTTDGSGGAIVAWEDWRGDFYNGIRAIYAQRISSSGNPLWGAGGAQVTDQSGSSPSIAGDGNGGAIIAWDYYVGTSPNGQRDLYVQKMSSSGFQVWTANGVALCTLSTNELYPKVSSDAGGAIIVWEDYRNGKSNLFAQNVNSDGVVQWTANGVPVITSTSYGYRWHKVTTDGSGGAYIVAVNVNFNVIQVQRINSSGVYQWNQNGYGLSTGSDPQLINTGGTEMAVTWSKDSGSGNIYVQKLNQSCELQWGENGIAVCTNQSAQYAPGITMGRNGDVIIAWDDYRNNPTTSTDIYAQLVSVEGQLGIVTGIEDLEPSPAARFTLEQNHPNPFTEDTEIKFRIHIPGQVTLKVFGIDGRTISTLVDDTMQPGDYSVRFTPAYIRQGFYYYRLVSGDQYCTKPMVLVK
jgi:hypothetical protein